jgi:hypothetical protein
MQEYIKPMINYWRKSLLDGVPVAGALKAGDLQSYWQLSKEIFAAGQLSDELLERWQKHLQKGKKNAGDIALIPYIYQKRALHGQASSTGEPDFVLPLYLPCAATKEGEITPQDRCLPIIPRELLEPLDDFDGLVIGSMDNFSNSIDALQVASPPEYEESPLLALLEAGKQILDKTAPDLDQAMEEKGYTRLEMCLLLPDFQTSMVGKIIALCDCILRNLSSKNVKEIPLLRTLSTGTSKEKPLPDLRANFCTRVGYPNREHSLADNQRLAAACLLETGEGEILAVNGPPGTGKTAVLLSLIATEYIQAILRGDDTPPVIFAASTNNQAVTNILDDFAKIPADEGLFKRWIPWIKSFGSYYPSAYKKSEAESAGRHTDLFFEEARRASQRTIALEEYSTSCLDFFGEPISLEQTPARIKSALQQEHGKLVQFEKKLAELEAMSGKLGGAVEGMSQEAVKTTYANIETCIRLWRETYEKRRFSEKWLAWLISGIRSRVEKRMRNIYDEYWPKTFCQVFPYPGIGKFPDDADEFRILLRKYQEAADECRTLAREWTGGKELEEFSLIAADRLFDASIRRRMFWLSVHYWEARWLIETENPRNEKWYSNPEDTAKEWRQRMMLTPCAVATFHQLAGLLIVWRRPLSPVYNLIDLLIVEEAGQVSPEIAGPSFSLAKRAVIVGDALQIEPVWNVKGVIDNANAKSEGLDPKVLHSTGRAASSGSVIRMAQTATSFSQDFTATLGAEKASKLGRGLYLVEHRRCITPIIDYCNHLCYEGILIPKNNGGPRTDIPPMFGVHVQGASMKAVTGSRYNEHEAQAIAYWLATNSAMLQETYQTGLQGIVSIITPFKAQIGKINNALKNQGISGITVGTVHALQGAERSIVLFSPVCTQADAQGRLFFNSSPNMLNVAVSRAKENFIIFGDMGLIALVDPQSPYGLFSKYLQFDDSPLNEHQAFPADLRPTCFLRDAQKHDDFLMCVLSNARKTIIIVSPWVTEAAMQRFSPAIEKSIANGVIIHVITDPQKCLKLEHNGLPRLEQSGATVHKVSTNLHAKLLFCDEHTVACGSFNWLSASRNAQYAQVEQSAILSPLNTPDVLQDLCERCKIQKNSITLN